MKWPDAVVLIVLFVCTTYVLTQMMSCMATVQPVR